MYVEKTGLGPFETAHVEARADGRFTVDTGASSMGPGLETVLAQILGEALGLPADRFDVRHADTSNVESGVGTYGSRGTVTAGNAAAMAAAKLIGEATVAGGGRLARARGRGRGMPPERSSARGRRVTLAELAAARRWRRAPRSPCRRSPMRAARSGSSPTWTSRRARCASTRVVIGADVGRAVNPALVDAQLVGGVAFGIGNTLHESLEYDGGGTASLGHAHGLRPAVCADVPPVEGFYQEVPGDDEPARPAGPGRVRQPGPGRRHRQRGL